MKYTFGQVLYSINLHSRLVSLAAFLPEEFRYPEVEAGHDGIEFNWHNRATGAVVRVLNEQNGRIIMSGARWTLRLYPTDDEIVKALRDVAEGWVPNAKAELDTEDEAKACVDEYLTEQGYTLL